MLPFVIGCVVIALDFISKSWVNQHLPVMLPYMVYPYGGIGVFESFAGIEFSISHLTNRGAAWGTLSHFQGWLVGARILLIAGLVGYTFFGNIQKAWKIPLALVISGAIGNVADYFIYGHVIDMFHFVLWGYDFPVFNVADSAVSIGVFWLIAITSFQKNENQVSI